MEEVRDIKTFDYIIIGAGMGGLSVANFLAKYNKEILVLEKHNIPGGLVTSFARKDIHFDLGLHGLYELKENQAIPQFLEYWGAPQLCFRYRMVLMMTGKQMQVKFVERRTRHLRSGLKMQF